MRRFAGLLVLTFVAAGVLAGAAMAKEGGIELSSTPAGTKPGDPWTPTLTLVGGSPELLAQARPGVAIRNVGTAERLEFPAKATKDPHQYSVRVVFPHEGWWIVEGYDGVSGRSYTFGGQYYIAAPGSEAPTAGISSRRASEGGSFPIWPTAAGGSALLLAAVGAALFLRRQRLGLSH
jgi:hypothetical protein